MGQDHIPLVGRYLGFADCLSTFVGMNPERSRGGVDPWSGWSFSVISPPLDDHLGCYWWSSRLRWWAFYVSLTSTFPILNDQWRICTSMYTTFCHPAPKVQDLYANAIMVWIVPRSFLRHDDTGMGIDLGPSSKPDGWTSSRLRSMIVSQPLWVWTPSGVEGELILGVGDPPASSRLRSFRILLLVISTSMILWTLLIVISTSMIVWDPAYSIGFKSNSILYI